MIARGRATLAVVLPVRLLAPWLLALWFVAPGLVLAQGASSPAAPPIDVAPPPKPLEASVGHAALKGLTLKAMSVSATAVIFSLGTGSMVTGGWMAGVNGLGSYVIYVGNEYMWDTYWPNTNLASNHQDFQATSSLSRGTLKYLTLKPMLTVLNLGLIYAFTDTLTATATTGVATIMTLPALFYVNNTLWDWYDWRNAPADAPVKAK